MSFQLPPQQATASKEQRISDLDTHLREKLGPGFFVCIPRGKFGVDGGGGTLQSIIRELGREAQRTSDINCAIFARDLDPDDPDVIKVANKYRDIFYTPQGGPVWTLRNKCVQAFLEKGFGEGLLFIDADMEWKPEEVEALRKSFVEHPEYDILGALVSTRTRDRLPCIYGWDDERKAYPRLNVVPPGDVIEVKGLGGAFTVVRRTLLERMTPVRFGWYWQVYELSEDLYFCTRAVHECGAKIGVDTRIKPRHIGLHGFTYAEEPPELQYIRTDMMERFGDTIARYLYKTPTVVDRVFKEATAPTFTTADAHDQAMTEMVRAFAHDLEEKIKKGEDHGCSQEDDVHPDESRR